MSATSFSLSAQTKSKKSAVGNEATSLTTGGHSNTTTATTGSGAASQTAGLGHCWLSPAWWIRRRCSSLLSDDLLTGFVGPDSHPSVSTGLDFRFASTTFLLLLLNVTQILAIPNLATRLYHLLTSASSSIPFINHRISVVDVA